MKTQMIAGMLLGSFLYMTVRSWSQEIPMMTEQQLENMTDNMEEETEDDSFLQQMEQFRKHPVYLNQTTGPELKELRILTDIHIHHLLEYRRVFGPLLSVFELQAIPGWDLSVIRRLLPFIDVSIPFSAKDAMKERFRNGEQSFLGRISLVLQKAKGFVDGPGGEGYQGTRPKIFMRYKYVYKNLLSYGVTADKDAGEGLFQGIQKAGFDFYSVHFFSRKMGWMEALAIGDFTVNMGQGLIQWQSLAFKKSAEITAVKRQSPVLRPYNSAGEYNFKRGIGITMKKGDWEWTGFFSQRKLSAGYTLDSLTGNHFFSSFQTSGNHRTQSEIADRNKLKQVSMGTSVRYERRAGHIALNAVNYLFSAVMKKKDEPYNLYAMNGRQWHNGSMDYAYTFKSLHVFGELAIDRRLNRALLNGLLVSIDSKLDLSLVHRKISKDYQAVLANAFTESTSVNNEDGLFIGIRFLPISAVRLDAYADIYRFPWLRYQADAPGRGRDYLIQLTYIPNKQVEVAARFRFESKQTNQAGDEPAMDYLEQPERTGFRLQVNISPTKEISLRQRMDLAAYYLPERETDRGFLLFSDFLYKPMQRPYSLVMRWQYFETGSYNSRLYAYENDVLYGYSIPVFSGKGYRYYLGWQQDLGRRWTVWFRWAHTIYLDREVIGSAGEEISGNDRSELKLQIRYIR